MAEEKQQPANAETEAAWVMVQRKTFTKWCNSHLAKKGFPLLTNIQGMTLFQTSEKN